MSNNNEAENLKNDKNYVQNSSTKKTSSKIVTYSFAPTTLTEDIPQVSVSTSKAVVVDGAMLECSQGSSPCKLSVTSQSKVTVSGSLCATIDDSKGGANIPQFGSCSSKPNKAPCGSPSTSGPWSSGSHATAGGSPKLLEDAVLPCNIGGKITISSPGQSKNKSS